MRDYVTPTKDASSFHCPYCKVLAHQLWFIVYAKVPTSEVSKSWKPMSASKCSHCQAFAIWFGDNMIIPSGSGAPPPSPDMPEDVATTYNEAQSVFNLSPRASAALLRLAIEQLCQHLVPEKDTINEAIAELVARTTRGEDNGIAPSIQKALDTVRVIGNHAVHPGTIQLNDDRDTAAKLFNLVNHIVQHTITIPAEIAETYSSKVPATTQAAIAKRDKPKTPAP